MMPLAPNIQQCYCSDYFPHESQMMNEMEQQLQQQAMAAQRKLGRRMRIGSLENVTMHHAAAEQAARFIWGWTTATQQGRNHK